MHADDLARLPMFAGLSPDQLARLEGHFEVVGYMEVTEIFAAGDRADQLYILRSGEVVIRYRPYDGGSLDVTLIQPGGAFGWSAALKRAYYTSSAFCRTDVQVLSISANALHKIMSDNSELAGLLLERTALIAGSRLDSLGRQVIELLQPKTHRPTAKRGTPSSRE